ncbi:MAG: hypothetical protein ABFS35_05160 [Bacteroidota bacterium]
MEYKGRYEIFDPTQIKTYPVSERTNKVKLDDLIRLEEINKLKFDIEKDTEERITQLAKEIILAREKDLPVVFFTGAHLVKNGLTLLIGDLVKRGMFTMVSGNGATSIHDFELGLFGETSEYVPQALEKGQFGMAFEFNYINAALIVGNKYKLGYGESVGRMMHDEDFRKEIAKTLGISMEEINFKYRNVSLQATCYEEKVPLTIHVGIGTDVLDQHRFFDGCAKGACSGRDFLIYTNEISKLSKGGVILNVGSAVTGPEVFLKAASMVGNTGYVPDKIITANFDLRPYNPTDITNDNTMGYYFRDQKSIVARVPEAYKGEGYYIGGNQKKTIPVLYKKLIELSN